MAEMSVPKPIFDAKGSWKGKSKLNLPWLAPDKRVSECDSDLHVDCDRQGTYATIVYEWSYEGKRQEGTLILAGSKTTNTIEIGWADSWHQNSGVLHLSGHVTDDAKIKTKGTYNAEGQEWGWTIAVEVTASTLSLKMENVTPAGEATWAVDGEYHRA